MAAYIAAIASSFLSFLWAFHSTSWFILNMAAVKVSILNKNLVLLGVKPVAP